MSIFQKIERLIQQNRINRRIAALIGCVALFVAFLTSYFLILPAITAQDVPICGIENHEHVPECFSQNENIYSITCGNEEHVHLEKCYDENNVLICIIPEHTHIDKCIEYEAATYNTISGNDIIDEEDNQEMILSFENWISNIVLQSSWDGYYWDDVTDGKISLHQMIRFNINYEVPPYTLNNNYRTIIYQIPAQVVIKEIASGDVFDKSGEIVGIYSISTDGLISITFNDEFVEKNQNGKIIIGDVHFDANVSELNIGDDDHAVINFTDDIQIVLDITDKTKNSNDLQCEKTASVVKDSNLIEYTIIITSENGTSDTITLVDKMSSSLILESEIEVSDKNNNKIEVEAFDPGTTEFEIYLPKMEAGDIYTITYVGKVSDINNYDVVKNEIVATSKDNNSNKLKDTTYIETPTSEFESKTMVEKTGVQSETEDKITWTITINPDKKNISGYTLTDLLNNQEFSGEVKVNIDGIDSENITIPYIFPDNCNSTYIITYETTKNRPIGNYVVTNKAIITSSDGDNQYVGTANVNTSGVGGGYYNPLTKKVGKMNFISENIAEINWDVTIDAGNSDIDSGWTFEDYLNDNNYFTKTQLEKLKESINKNTTNYTISYIKTDWSQTDTLEDDVKYKAYKITFNEKLEKGTIFNWNYNSTTIELDMSKKYTFSNGAKINNTCHTEQSFIYNPLVQKMDSTGKINNTTHNYEGTDEDNVADDGLINWKILLNIPDEINTDYIIKEILPNGIELLNVEMKVDNVTTNLIDNDIFNKDFDITLTENILKINLPKNFLSTYKEKTIEIYVNTKIQDTFEWGEANAGIHTFDFTNNVEVLDTDDNILGKSTHTQTINKKQDITENENIIKKSTLLESTKTDVIPYRIEINKECKDLSPDNELIINDIMNYYGGTSSAVISLVPNSFIVYQILEDGTQQKLSESDYSYTYENYTTENSVGLCENTLKITVPDEMSLVIEYKYKLFGPENTTVTGIVNKSSIMNIDGENGSSVDGISINISHSGATATTPGLIISKVDANNNLITLPNAVFEIYKYNGNEYEIITNTLDGSTKFVTDSKGQISVDELIYNAAYKIVEIISPNGYTLCAPHYFIIEHKDTISYPIIKPENFLGQSLMQGIPIVIENEKPLVNVNVKKIWQDGNGIVTDVHPEYVEAKLHRYVYPENVWNEISDNNGPILTYNTNLNIVGAVSNEAAQDRNIGNGKWWDDNYTFEAGTTIELTVNCLNTWYSDIAPVTLNGVNLINTYEDNNSDDGHTFKYVFTIEENSKLLIITDWEKDKWNYSLTVLNSNNNSSNFDKSPYFENASYKTTILNDENNWEYTFTDLPQYGIDDNGNKVFYEYTVTETIISNYNLSISGEYNNDTKTYNFIMTNKEIPKTNYQLPATGGIGQLPIYLFGILLIIVSSAMFFIKNKK